MNLLLLKNLRTDLLTGCVVIALAALLGQLFDIALSVSVKAAALGVLCGSIPHLVADYYATREHLTEPDAKQILLDAIIGTIMKYALVILGLGACFKFTDCHRIFLIAAFIAIVLERVINTLVHKNRP